MIINSLQISILGVMKNIFYDCPPVVEKLDNADFSKKALINLSKEYHEYVCNDEPCIIYEKKFHKKRFRYGFDFSFGPSKLNYDYVNLQMKMHPIMHYQFGINSQMNLDEAEAFNIKLSLRFYSYKNELLNDMDYAIGAFPSDLHYKYAMLKPELQFKYQMKVWKIVPFASAGLFTNIFLTDKGYIYNERFDITVHFTSAGTDKEKESWNFMIGGAGEIGFETAFKPVNLSFSLFYENFLAHPLRASNNLGLRFGYFLYF